MQKVEWALLGALKAFLDNKILDWKVSKERNTEFWDRLFVLARSQKVFPMVFETVYQCEALNSYPKELVAECKEELFRTIATEGIRREFFLRLYDRMLEAGLTPIVVKGIICRQLYNKADYRVSSDEDLFLPKSQADVCHQLLLSQGFETKLQWEKGEEPPNEVTYLNLKQGLILEIHYELFDERSLVYGSWNRFFLHTFEHKNVMVIDKHTVYTMNPSDHFFYLICHMLKHFLHSGFGIRQICDMAQFLKVYGNVIDWEEFRRKLKLVDAETFFAALLQISEMYLGLDCGKVGVPEYFKRKKLNCKNMLSDILDGGVYGGSSLARKHSSTMTLNAFSHNIRTGKKDFSLWKTAFPDMNYMESTYDYLKKHKWMLPIAWLHRMVDYFRETRWCRSENSAGRSLRIGRQRILLLEEYQIIRKRKPKKKTNKN